MTWIKKGTINLKQFIKRGKYVWLELLFDVRTYERDKSHLSHPGRELGITNSQSTNTYEYCENSNDNTLLKKSFDDLFRQFKISISKISQTSTINLLVT